MTETGSDAPRLSVVVTCTIAGTQVDRCLAALRDQVDAPSCEVIVPVGPSIPAADVERWRCDFPEVKFPALAADTAIASDDPAARHLIYDRFRTLGLSTARGEWLAMTEDNARPATDWCAQIAAAHTRLPHAAIGGAIDSKSTEPLTQAVYFSDFGRYQSPLPEGATHHISDVNVSYKRAALESVSDVWRGGFHEPAVHAALRERGETLWREPRIVVEQDRGSLELGACLRERFAWGRLYAGKRAHQVSVGTRILLGLLAPALPPLLLWRLARITWTRGRNRAAFVRALPWLALLSILWSAGETVGIWTGRATSLPNSQCVKVVT